jgi:hypothetical protein
MQMEDTVTAANKVVTLQAPCNISLCCEFSERDLKFQLLSENGTDVTDCYPGKYFVLSFQGII